MKRKPVRELPRFHIDPHIKGRCFACGGPADSPAVDNHGMSYFGCRVCRIVLDEPATKVRP